MAKESRRIGAIGWIGIAATFAYAMAMLWLVDGRWSELQELKLNELGDFLAGSFGPLAILWLVLGYFQQGIELRQNSASLQLQAEELANSVTQQAALAKSSQQSLEIQRQEIIDAQKMREESAQPNFIQQSTKCVTTKWNDGTKSHLVTCEILNTGSTCSQIEFTSIPKGISATVSSSISETNKIFYISCDFQETEFENNRAEIIISYANSIGKIKVQDLHLIRSGQPGSEYSLSLPSYFFQRPTTVFPSEYIDR